MGFFDFVSSDIGIDLGTANTLIYVKGKGIVLNEPTVVALDSSTEEVLTIGKEAKEMLGKTPGEIKAIKPLKDGVIADFEVTEKLLRYFIRRVIKHRFLMRPRIIICVPSGITEVEKRAVRDSAETEAREVFLIHEPMAAAIGMGLPVEQPAGNMIIDIGGGTSEIAVVALSGIVNSTSIRVGGDEMDDAIVQYLKKTYNLLIGESTAEGIKMRIGSAFPLEEEMEMEVKGRDLVAGIPKTMKVSSEEIRVALNEPVGAIVEAVKQALERTPPELASDILDRGIIMTGGGSIIKGFDKRLRQETNLPVNIVDDPLTCVAKGAGRVLDNLNHYSKMLIKARRG